ncbi:MAG: hypothetical protein ABIP51_07230 [Bacteroidia bacterium]
MPTKLPTDFNPRTEKLEFKEEYTRDTLSVNVDEWVKFRHIVRIGLDSVVLKPTKKGSKTKSLIKTFPDIGKSHYQAVTNLGFCKQSLLDAEKYEKENEFLFEKALYDFYYHAGVVLDSVGRLIFIILIKDATTRKKNKKPKSGPYRHWVDWGKVIGEIKSKNKKGFAKLYSNKQTKEIINIRNNYTHNWGIVKGKNLNTDEYFWPLAVRTKRNYKWPWGQDSKTYTGDYKTNVRIVTMLQTDFQHIENEFNVIFQKLIILLGRFEKEHNVTLI